jgi:hypothetical protein
MLKVYFVVSMLHTPDMKVAEIGPIDTLEKCTRLAIAIIRNAPTFQTYRQQRERSEIASKHRRRWVDTG